MTDASSQPLAPTDAWSISSRPPNTITVQASSTSLRTMVFVPMLGFTGVALSLLMLSGRMEPPFRYRNQLSQYLVLAMGIGLAIYGLVLVLNGWRGRRSLLEISGQSVRVQEARRRVEVRLDEVLSFQTKTIHRQCRLVVVTMDGREYFPILQPDGSNWAAVAQRFDQRLSEHTASTLDSQVSNNLT